MNVNFSNFVNVNILEETLGQSGLKTNKSWIYNRETQFVSRISHTLSWILAYVDTFGNIVSVLALLFISIYPLSSVLYQGKSKLRSDNLIFYKRSDNYKKKNNNKKKLVLLRNNF